MSTKNKRKINLSTQERDNLRWLKKVGLINVDLRKPATRYQQRRVRELGFLRDEGAAIVKAPRGTISKIKHSDTYRVIKNRVIIPKAPNERVRISKTGEVKRTRISPLSKKFPTSLPNGKAYRVPFNRGRGKTSYRWWAGKRAYANMLRDMAAYEADKYHDWMTNIEIVDYP